MSGLKALLFSTLLIHSIWSASATAVAEELEGKFQHMAAEGDRIMAGAPKTLAQCAGTDASLDNSTAASIAYYARVAPLTILAESGDFYSVTPTHPSCLGLSNPWVKQPGHLLTRRCGTAWLTIAAIEESEATDTELEIKAGVTVTIAYADGSYCTTHLSKQKADSESPVASATTWGYAIIGVGISSVISLMGICLLICHRRVVQNYMKELLALSAGTFIGSVIFSLLPETGLELGMDVKITSVIFGGILFGMLSETVIHGMVGWFAKKPPAATASSHSLGPDPASPDQGTELIEVAPAMQRSSSLNTSPDNQTVIGIDCAAPCTDIQFASESLLGPNEDACTVVPDTTMPNLTSNIESSIAQTPSAMSKPNDEETSLQKLPSVEDDENHHHHHVRRRASDKKTNYHDDLEGLHGHGHSHTRGDSLAEARHAALINTIADALHNFIDGALIGATFLVNPATGWTTTAAVALHELPQEVNHIQFFALSRSTQRNDLHVIYVLIGASLCLLLRSNRFATLLS